MLYHQLLKHKDDLSRTLQDMKRRLSSYPDGELICAKNGNDISCLYSRNGAYTHIPKKDSELINILAEKKLVTARLEDLEIHLPQLLTKSQKNPPKTEVLRGLQILSEIKRRFIFLCF